MRMLLGAIVLVVGVGAGWFAAQAMQPAAVEESKPVAEPAELVSLRAETRRVADERAALAEQLAALQSENEMLRGEQLLMEDVLDDAARTKADAVADSPAPAEAVPAVPAQENGNRDQRRQPTPEQMEEFRKQQEAQRAEWRARLDEELARMGDPNAAQNFQALLDYRQDEQALREQMRDAKTDAERERIADDLRATTQASRQLLNSQQDSILRNVAASNGISDAASQQKFVEATRAALENPFFTMEPMLSGGGRGPRGGPWGGRGR